MSYQHAMTDDTFFCPIVSKLVGRDLRGDAVGFRGCPFIRPSVHLSSRPPVHADGIGLFDNPTMHPQMRLTICASVKIFINSFTYGFYPSIHQPMNSPIHPLIHLPFHLSIHPSMNLATYTSIHYFTHPSIHPSTQ